MSLRLFNTLSQKKEEFTPLSDVVRVYSCGPTVYHYAHLGNLRSYVFMDVLHRTLGYVGYDVTLVVNITDVGHLVSDADEGEDKMEKGAAREGKSVWEVAEYYTDAFMKDIVHLNIKQPTKWTRATDYIQEQIDLVQQIVDNGYTYRTSDGIYFDTSKLPNYGELIPGFKPENLQAGKRVDMGEKKNSTDFALWKFSPSDEKRQMEWDSPWGVGFPGWHIECTAMGCCELGETFDIHTGGVDHISIHHTNEIAQARGAFGCNHAQFWLHNEFLVDKGGKMSKSKGDFLRLQTIIDEGYDALDYRYLCLLTHYRKPLMFSYEALDAARSARLRLTNAVIDLKESVSAGGMSEQRMKFQKKFTQALYDDINTSQALAVVFELLRSDLSREQQLSLILDWEQVLGLNLHKAAREVISIPQEVQELVDKREEARKNKDFSEADRLREEISKRGFVVDDTNEGPSLSRHV
ncbi:MAG: cysteine--tRNA ligase [Candidatus Woesearchaeota archaeon]